MTEIICAGFGGQGVLVAGNILAFAGMEAGKIITWYPSYGSEMRGGTANCNIKISDEEIASPYVKAPDVLICLNEVSIGKFMGTMKPGSILVVNSSLCSPDYAFRDDIRVVRVPASDIANELGNPRGLNIAALGAAVAASGMFDCEAFKGYIDKFFARKGKVNPKNGMCFDAGVKSVTGTK